MKDDTIISIFMFFLGMALIFELTILGIAFFGADKVECNLLWCIFSTERTNIETRQSCSVNGNKINCSDFANKYPDSYYRCNNRVFVRIWSLCKYT